MRETYLKDVVLLLVVVVAVQGYFLYYFNNTINEKEVSTQAKDSSAVPNVVPFIGLFDRNEDPFIEMERMRREMENRFMKIEDFFKTVPSLNKAYSKLYRTPSFDMKEQDGKYFITMEVPGLDKHAINIKPENGQLIVSAHVSKEKDNNTTTYYQRERRTSSYRHAILIPTDANERSLHSEYKDGLLTITFEKTIP